MKLLRRILAALVMAGVAAAGIRLKGAGGVPPQRGGWRPLDLPSDRPDEPPADAASGVT